VEDDTLSADSEECVTLDTDSEDAGMNASATLTAATMTKPRMMRNVSSVQHTSHGLTGIPHACTEVEVQQLNMPYTDTNSVVLNVCQLSDSVTPTAQRSVVGPVTPTASNLINYDNVVEVSDIQQYSQPGMTMVVDSAGNRFMLPLTQTRTASVSRAGSATRCHSASAVNRQAVTGFLQPQETSLASPERVQLQQRLTQTPVKHQFVSLTGQETLPVMNAGDEMTQYLTDSVQYNTQQLLQQQQQHPG